MDVFTIFTKTWICPECNRFSRGPVERFGDADSDTVCVIILTRYILLKHTVNLGSRQLSSVVLPHELDKSGGAGWVHF